MSPFCGATDTPVLDFWWYLLWVSKPEWAALFKLGRGILVTHSLGFTSGTTPADLLAASMAAEPSLPHTCKALVALETRSYHAAAHSVRSGRPDALPTELSWLDYRRWLNRLCPTPGYYCFFPGFQCELVDFYCFFIGTQCNLVDWVNCFEKPGDRTRWTHPI